jgi:hypothetical protein
MLDTNGDGGSTGIGTETLRTRVARGDQLLWDVIPLECEAFAAIDEIVIDEDFCAVERRTYPGTDISYWVGTVKRDRGEVPYHIRFKLGIRPEPMTTASTPFLVGGAS